MKKEAKKGKRSKIILIVLGILVILYAIGSASGNSNEENNNLQNTKQVESEPASDDKINQPKESGEIVLNESSETVPNTSNETESEDDEPLGFNVIFSNTYRNDVTGNWRLARIAESINIEEYAIDYYNNYFESDTEVHIIVNFTLNTTTKITVIGNLLDVSITEYVDKEEHDASIACSGMFLGEYHVNIDTGEIEKIQ